MGIYRLTVPIPDYYNEDVFYQHLYFRKGSCPTRKEVMEELERQHEEALKIGGNYGGCWQECINSIKDTKKFPVVYSNVYETNSFTNVETCTGIHRSPITMTHIDSRIWDIS